MEALTSLSLRGAARLCLAICGKRSRATTGAGLIPVKIDRRKAQNLVKFASWTFEGSEGEDAPLKSMDPSLGFRVWF